MLKSLRPQPVSPERDRARRGKVRGKSLEGNPAAEWGQQTNSHLHHICQSSRLCPSSRKVGGDNLHLRTNPASASMRIVGTPGRASSIWSWRWRRRTASPPAPAAAAPSHMRVSQIANLSNLTTRRIFCTSRDAATALVEQCTFIVRFPDRRGTCLAPSQDRDHLIQNLDHLVLLCKTLELQKNHAPLWCMENLMFWHNFCYNFLTASKMHLIYNPFI